MPTTATPYRLSAQCPDCGSPLRLKYRRADRQPFLGCTAYPECCFVDDYDRALQEALAQREPAAPAKKRRRKASVDQDDGQLRAKLEETERFLKREMALTSRLERERRSLWRDIDALENELLALHSAPQVGLDREVVLAKLTQVITVVHPDRWGGSNAAAEECTKLLLAWREELRNGHR